MEQASRDIRRLEREYDSSRERIANLRRAIASGPGMKDLLGERKY